MTPEIRAVFHVDGDGDADRIVGLLEGDRSEGWSSGLDPGEAGSAMLVAPASDHGPWCSAPRWPPTSRGRGSVRGSVRRSWFRSTSRRERGGDC